MSQARQTLKSIQSDFDRIALLGNEDWNHNAQYHRYLLNKVPERCRHILEIGCGAGEFSRLLAQRAEKVFAIDLSPQMIRLARTQSKSFPNIEFVERDVMTYQLPDNQFDCIATLTTLHHLPMESVLSKIKAALKPGGIFICLDLYQRSDLTDLLYDAAAYPADLFCRFLKTGSPKQCREMSEAYTAHGKTDTYLTLSRIKRICAKSLPDALISRHLFWRYSIVWKKESARRV